MVALPFAGPGRFFRGNLHTHSTRSDGEREPEAVVEAYRQQGYDFLVLSDHFRAKFGFPITDTRVWRDATFTTLLGAELHAPALQAGDDWHILAVGLPIDFAPTTADETGPSLARRARAAGAYVGMAHPGWYGLTLQDARTLDGAHAVEIYNAATQLVTDRGDSSYLYDQLLSEGRRLNAFAADDAHFHRALIDGFGGWVQVFAAELTPEALLAALISGDYYSSQGPEIFALSLSGQQLQITSSPVRAVFVQGAQRRCERQLGVRLTQATIDLSAFAGSYARITIVDEQGRRAWSNPLWLD